MPNPPTPRGAAPSTPNSGAAPLSIPHRIIIWGVPIAKKRPRFARAGNFVRTYNPQQTEEGRTLWEIRAQWNRPPLDCPVSACFQFGLPIPKSTSKKRALLMVKNEIKHTKRPDLDNLIKYYKDVCNGTIWKDDSQVFSYYRTSKFYAENPFTLIEIRPYQTI